MNSTQITCFLEVAKQLSFARAAEILDTTQPVISYQIKSLETELNVCLFKRNHRRVTLTAAGSYLYTELAPIHQKTKEIIGITQEIQRQEQPSFILLVRRLLDYSIITKSIKRFYATHPNVHVDIMDHNDRSSNDLLITNEIQLAFCYQYEVHNHPKIRFLPCDKSNYYVLVNKDHRLAAYKYLTFEDLAGENLLLANTELHKNPLLISLKELEKFHILVSPPYSTFDGMLLSVEAGLGFTILPCSKSKQFSGLTKITLKDVAPIPLGFAWAPSLADPFIYDFVETAEAVITPHPPASKKGKRPPKKQSDS